MKKEYNAKYKIKIFLYPRDNIQATQILTNLSQDNINSNTKILRLTPEYGISYIRSHFTNHTD